MKESAMQRRSFLGQVSLGGLGILATAIPRARPFEGSLLTYEQFLAQAVPVARELVKDVSRIGEDRYLLALASFAVRLRDVPVPPMRENTYNAGDAARTWIGANDGGDPFTVLHWRMDPGARIEQHPHTYGSVVTLCLEGEVRVRNYEMADGRDFDTKESFRVRRVVDQILRPGEVNLVALEHGYTHGFVAGPQGARGLDLTTRTRAKRASPNLVVEEEPLDEAAALFEGRWIYR